MLLAERVKLLNNYLENYTIRFIIDFLFDEDFSEFPRDFNDTVQLSK
jgi:hypothetical protein